MPLSVVVLGNVFFAAPYAEVCLFVHNHGFGARSFLEGNGIHKRFERRPRLSSLPPGSYVNLRVEKTTFFWCASFGVRVTIFRSHHGQNLPCLRVERHEGCVMCAR